MLCLIFVSSDLNFLSKSFLKNCCSSTSFPSLSTPLKVKPSLLIIPAERPVSTSTTVGLIKKPSSTPLSNEYLNVGSPSSHPKIELGEIPELPKQMTQEQMNDLFGEDPYLGQTSYLQSPEGFTKRVKSK